jgi:hypothetical protein
MRKVATYSEVENMPFERLLDLHDALSYVDDADHFAMEEARKKKQ